MKHNRSFAALFASALILSMLTGCAMNSDTVHQPDEPQDTAPVQVHQSQFEEIEACSSDDLADVALSGSTAHSSADGCCVSNSLVTITKAGTYRLSGTFDGQIVVDAGGEDVRLVLDGVDITCDNSAPIYIKDGHLVTITLADGSQNTVTDGARYEYDDAEKEEPNAAVFSKADMVLEGSGSLTVNANFNNGIQSKDTLEIHSGTYTVNAANHGITGKDSLEIGGGSLTVNSGGDGLRSNNADSSDVGWVSIVDGSFVINAGQDGLQAESTLHIGGGTFDIISGGGSANSSSENENWGSWEPGSNMPHGGFGGFGGGRNISSGTSSDGTSAKGIKAGSDVLVENGIINIDSSDDALHSNSNLSVTGGEISVSSGDDGIHADSVLEITGGLIGISKSYEGAEGVRVIISGGETNITASDDGINSAGGRDGESDRPGADIFAVDDNCDVTITGGTVILDAGGDGIDSNGHLHIKGGTVVVNGPTNSGNGALDYAGECIISGGTVTVAGSSGMAQGAGGNSTQANMMLCFNGTIKGGTLISFTDSQGNVILSFAPSKDFSSVLVSCPAMSVGQTYTLWLGGSCTGQNEYGVYTDGTLDGATRVTEVTISQISTNYGGGGGMGGPGGHGGPGGMGAPGMGPGGR